MMSEENFLSHTKFKDLIHDDLTEDDWFKIGIELFNDEFYFESHEAWEEIWQTDNSNNREFFQGLIQLAAVMVHSTNENLKGMQRLTAMAFEKLGKYPDIHFGIKLRLLMDDIQKYLGFAESDMSSLQTHAKPEIILFNQSTT